MGSALQRQRNSFGSSFEAPYPPSTPSSRAFARFQAILATAFLFQWMIHPHSIIYIIKGVKERALPLYRMSGLVACFEAVAKCKEGSLLLLVCVAHVAARKQGEEGLDRRTGVGLEGYGCG